MRIRLKKKDIKGTLIMLAVMLVLSFIYVTISPKLSIELDVGKSTYDKYDIGDTYYFTKYDGAFGVPFYLTGTEK